MQHSKRKEIDINIETDILTPISVANITNALFEFLLYQRNQIEFVYKTFKCFVNQWSEDGSENQNSAFNSFNNLHFERQKEQAKLTKEAISAMRNVIFNAFDKSNVKKIRFLFGATTFTPKEAYTIHIPSQIISKHHRHDNHQISQAALNAILLSLVTREDLYGVFSNNLGVTNMFMEIETLNCLTEEARKTLTNNIFPKQISELPSSCKDVHIHIRHKSIDQFEKINKELNCCQLLQVFEDVSNEDAINQNISKEAKDNTKSDNQSNELDATSWWEVDIIVRGFRQKQIKGKSIWTK